MKLYLLEDKKVSLHDLKENQQKIKTKYFNFTVIHHKDKYLLKIGREVKTASKVLSLYEFTYLYDVDNHKCTLLLINENNTLETFEKYALNKSITIGKCTSCDIQINHPLCDLVMLKIDPSNQIIYLLHKNDLISLNNILIEDTIKFQFSNTLLIGEVRIIFMEDGIMMNCNENITVHLPLYTKNIDTNILDVPRKKEIIYNEIPYRNPTFEYSYKRPIFNNSYSIQHPLFLNVFPSILISFTSLLIGCMNAYNAYILGGEMHTILPMLIFPSVMLFTTITFQPLKRYFETKEKKKQIQKLMEQDSELKEEIKQNYDQFVLSYQTFVNQYYPDITDINEYILNSSYIYLQTLNQPLLLRIGYILNGISITNQASKQTLDQLDFNSRYIPWLIDLNHYYKISINSSKNAEKFFKYLVLQIALRYERNVIVYTNESYMHHNIWMYSIPNVIHHDCFTITFDLNTARKNISQLKNAIVIVYCADFIELKDVNCIFIQSNKIKSIDLSIDDDKNTYYDHKKQKKGKFVWKCEKEFDVEKDLFLLRRKEYKKIHNDFLSIEGIHRLSYYDIQENWKVNHHTDSIVSLIGIDDTGHTISLDLRENKDGPHGLIAGTTGSGKTELLLSFLLSLALRYSYEDVQFVYIDFKGGGGVNAIKDLPHIVGTLTDLDTDTIERALVSFQNECKYREKCINQMNEVSEYTIMNLYDYKQHYDTKYHVPKLSELIIIIDEFAELKRLYPEFMNELISISRIGRSLGIHLILCTQKPAGVVSEEIWTNCNFKICLKVNEDRDSLEVIHSKDAKILKGSGEFILLSNHTQKRGLASYSNARINHWKHLFSYVIKDSTLKPINHSNSIPQVKQIMYEMNKIKTKETRKLWLDKLEHLTWDRNIKNGVIGIVDDYYHRNQYPLKIFHENQPNVLIITNDIEERLSFIYLLLVTFFNSYPSYQLFVIDDLNCKMDDLYVLDENWIELLTSDEKEKTYNLFHYLNHSSTNHKILLITDIARFYESDEQYRFKLRSLLERAQLLRLHIVIMTTSCSNLSFREMSFMNHRMVLKTSNLQEIQQVLETTEKKIVDEEECGLIKDKRILKFRYYVIDRKMLISLFSHESSKNKPFRIPCMPSQLDRYSLDLSKVPIGIAYSSYQWIYLDPCESIYVVSLYKYELFAYYQVMKSFCKCTFVDSKERDDGQLIFLTIDELRQVDENLWPILYIGESYSHQYKFHSKIKSIHQKQGILLKGLESELLKIL